LAESNENTIADTTNKMVTTGPLCASCSCNLLNQHCAYLISPVTSDNEKPATKMYFCNRFENFKIVFMIFSTSLARQWQKTLCLTSNKLLLLMAVVLNFS